MMVTAYLFKISSIFSLIFNCKRQWPQLILKANPFQFIKSEKLERKHNELIPDLLLRIETILKLSVMKLKEKINQFWKKILFVK